MTGKQWFIFFSGYLFGMTPYLYVRLGIEGMIPLIIASIVWIGAAIGIRHKRKAIEEYEYLRGLAINQGKIGAISMPSMAQLKELNCDNRLVKDQGEMIHKADLVRNGSIDWKEFNEWCEKMKSKGQTS